MVHAKKKHLLLGKNFPISLSRPKTLKFGFFNSGYAVKMISDSLESIWIIFSYLAHTKFFLPCLGWAFFDVLNAFEKKIFFHSSYNLTNIILTRKQHSEISNMLSDERNTFPEKFQPLIESIFVWEMDFRPSGLNDLDRSK